MVTTDVGTYIHIGTIYSKNTTNETDTDTIYGNAIYICLIRPSALVKMHAAFPPSTRSATSFDIC